MKNHIEIIRIEHYHAIALNGKLIVPESCDPLEDDLQAVFNVMPEGRISLSTKTYNDDEVDEFHNYCSSLEC